MRDKRAKWLQHQIYPERQAIGLYITSYKPKGKLLNFSKAHLQNGNNRIAAYFIEFFVWIMHKKKPQINGLSHIRTLIFSITTMAVVKMLWWRYHEMSRNIKILRKKYTLRYYEGDSLLGGEILLWWYLANLIFRELTSPVSMDK